MSQLLIQQYLNQLATLKRVSGSTRESVVREAFKDLLKGWARQYDLTFVPEHEISAPTKERRYVDGALMHTLRVPFGYWEAKDSKDDLDTEITKKFRAGYPKTNIIFDDSTQAVLIQHGEEIMRCAVDDTAALEKLLKLFFAYERPEIEAFRKAVVQFKTDLPAVLEALRDMIARAHAAEPKFRKASEAFLKHARDAINPSLTEADVREMLIQHVLTGPSPAPISLFSPLTACALPSRLSRWSRTPPYYTHARSPGTNCAAGASQLPLEGSRAYDCEVTYTRS